MISPALHLDGGVANFYRMLQPHLGVDFYIMQKTVSDTLAGKLAATFIDQLRFLWHMIAGRHKVVFLNPSLGKTAVMRDAIYSLIAKKIFKKKLVIFWHGWDYDFAKTITGTRLVVFRKSFIDADLMFVLANTFKNDLINWGFNNRIEVTTTCFEDSFANTPVRKLKDDYPVRILFLGRVEISKGVMIALKALESVRQKCQHPVELTIAGKGTALDEAKKYATELKLADVKFSGYVSGDAKLQLLSENDIFILPSYSEGMPCALLESMACGLVVLSRNVGGIPDFFETDKMGFITSSQDPEFFADAIIDIISNPSKMTAIQQYNREFAQKNFTASKIAGYVKDKLARI